MFAIDKLKQRLRKEEGSLKPHSSCSKANRLSVTAEIFRLFGILKKPKSRWITMLKDDQRSWFTHPVGYTRPKTVRSYWLTWFIIWGLDGPMKLKISRISTTENMTKCGRRNAGFQMGRSLNRAKELSDLMQHNGNRIHGQKRHWKNRQYGSSVKPTAEKVERFL